MWGWIKGIFTSSDKAVDMASTAVNGVVDGLDVAFFTDEEKSAAKMQALKMQLEFIKLAYDGNTTRSITRRIIAVGIISCELALIMGSAFMWKYDPEWAAHLFKHAQELGTLTLMVCGFYFGVHLLRGFQQKG